MIFEEHKSKRFILAVMIWLSVLVSAPMPAQAAGLPDLNGTWTAYSGNGTAYPKPAVITQSGASLQLDNGEGSVSQGQLTGNAVTTQQWGVSGTVSADGQRIDWVNNTYWVKRAAATSANTSSAPAANPSSAVNGRNVTKVMFINGSLSQTGDKQWAEYGADGAQRFTFTEQSRDDSSVYIQDASRNIDLQLDLQRNWISFRQNGSAKTDLYQITSSSAAPVVTPQRKFPETYSTPLQLKPKTATDNATPGYYNIAHMTNVTSAVDWALEQGANALEMDINFSSDGTPEKFKHGGICDCVCGAGASGVCAHLGDPVCEVNTDAATMLNYVAGKTGVALVVIDSKVGSLDESALQSGGKQIIETLDRELYGKGYRGDAIVGIGDREQFSYIVAAANAALASANREHYYYSIDQGGDQTAATIQKLLNLPSSNRVYGTGLTACSPNKYHEAIKKGVANENAGVVGLTYIWTIDKESSMTAYLDDGARGIITNEPGTLATVLKNRGARLAAAGEKIPVSSNNQYVASNGSTVGTKCDSNSDCDNTACARPNANNAEKVCCASNDTHNYGGYDYCANMPSGTSCWSDAMCASGTCKGNASGFQRGTCN